MHRLLLHIQVDGGRRVAIGEVSFASDLPELLRNAAEYYDANPDDCAAVCSGASGFTSAAGNYLHSPFSGYTAA